MSEQGPEPAIDPETGQQLGWWVPVEGGGEAIVDDEGRVQIAVDSDGQQIDISDLALDAGTELDFDPGQAEQAFADTAQRIDEEPDMDHEEYTDEDVETALGYQLSKLSEQLGRTLTGDDLERLAPRLQQQLQHHGMLDALAAAEDVGGLRDIDRRADRVEHAAARLRDLDAAATGPRAPQTFDLDDAAQRRQFMAARIDGTLIDGDTIAGPANPEPSDGAGDTSAAA